MCVCVCVLINICVCVLEQEMGTCMCVCSGGAPQSAAMGCQASETRAETGAEGEPAATTSTNPAQGVWGEGGGA